MRRRAFLAAAVSLVTCGAATAGCAKPKGAAPAVARRVVSLSPSTTEAMFAIGAGDLLVGRSRYCDYPAEALALPQVGGYVDPNLEAILALRPDLVVGARGPSGPQLAKKLAAQGAATYFPETESFAQIDEVILALGARTGREEGARRTLDAMHAREEEIARAVAGKPRPRVLLVFGLEPIVVAGPKSFPDEMITRAGGVNVVTEGSTYPMLGIERILALDPDVILNATMAEARGTERIHKTAPGWREVRAVKEGHVVPMADESVLRPGPRVAEGLAVIARALHPGT
jgi:iron complex transport system substrate-binding protein